MAISNVKIKEVADLYKADLGQLRQEDFLEHVVKATCWSKC